MSNDNRPPSADPTQPDDEDKNAPLIPEPTDFDQAARDGTGERIASGDTPGGSDQFTAPTNDRSDATDGGEDNAL